MRNYYTPIFRDVLTSRIWATSPATRAVWLWLRLSADPEGFVCATVSGIALSARVELEEARTALDLLESPDPEADPDDPYEGRIVEKVPRGWRVLVQEEERERARHESEKARKRKWAKKNRAAANDVEPEPEPSEGASTSEDEESIEPWVVDADVDADPTEVDPTKTKPKSKSKPKPKTAAAAATPPTPPGVFEAAAAPLVIARIPENWLPSEQLIADARIAGVIDFDERLKKLRRGPIGGQRGVFSHELEDYIRDFFGKWRTWGETDRAKAGEAPPSSQPDPTIVPGMPPWVYPKHAEFAGKHRLNLKRAATAFARQAQVKPGAMRKADVFGAFMKYLENLAQSESTARKAV